MALRFSFMVFFVFMEMFVDDSDVLVEAEDRAGQQERLRDIIEQSRSYVVDMYYLVSYKCDTARNEQHRTGVLRDFEALVFHGIDVLHQSASGCPAQKQGNDVTEHLKDLLKCLVHNFTCFKW